MSVGFGSVSGMSAMQVVPAAKDRSQDPVVARMDDLLAELAAVVADDSQVADADRIDRLDRLERARSVVAAVQVAETVRFARSQAKEQLAAGVHPKKLGQGIADQIALACRVSPWEGSRRLNVAKALWFDLPQTYGLLITGELRERIAEQVVTETRHLDSERRQAIDARIAKSKIERKGLRSAAACVRKHAYEADPQAYVERGRTERKHRRVSLRPAPDTMAWLTAYLPVEQGVACLAALRQYTDTLKASGDERSRDQIMADTLVERLTGQATAQDVNVEVQLLMPWDSLLDPKAPGSALIPGHGPVPGPIARDLILSTKGLRWWRRLFTKPTTDGNGTIVIGGDPARRRFDGWLEQLIRLRDQTCRDPYCDAMIRHLDHIRPYRVGGPTELINGRGECERGNLVREMPGWRVDLLHSGLEGRPHTIVITTPTGHRYHSEAPQPP